MKSAPKFLAELNGSQGQGNDDNRVVVLRYEICHSLKKAVMLVDFHDVEVDKFLIKGFAPREYGNEGINIKRVIST